MRRGAWPALLLVALGAALGLKAYLDHGNPAVPAAAGLEGTAGAAGAGASAAASAASAAVAAALASTSATAASAHEPQWGQPGEAAARVARAASAALASARAVAGLTPAPPAELVLDLCGVGQLTMPRPEGAAVDADAAWRLLPQPLGAMASSQAWSRVLAALSAPGQPDRARAAALVLQASAAVQIEPSTAPVAATATATAKVIATATATATRSLARLARTSPDSTVMDWALALCSREATASPDCRRLSARDLVRLAPDDGLSWLALARQPGLAAAQRDEALQKAAQAARFGGPSSQLALVVDSAWPDELPGYLHQQLLRTAQAVDAGLPRLSNDAALNLCTAAALADAGRRGRCEALARQIQAQGRDLATPGIAAVLGSRLGWPDSEVAALQQEEAALLRAAAPVLPPEQAHACGAVDATRDGVRAAAADGELQFWRRRLAMKPMTTRPAPSRP